MKQLLSNELSPITFGWGFLQAPIETVMESLTQWRMSLGRKIIWKSQHDALPKALLGLEPLSMPPHRELLLSTQSTWTAYFNNPINGGEPYPPVGHLAQRIKCWGIAIDCAPNIGRSYGAVGFSLFAPEEREWLNEERCILAMNDGGKWKFFTRGEVLPFEQTSHYKKRKIVERFTLEMLEEYCKHYGIDVFNFDFYHSEGYLIVDQSPFTKKMRTLSLIEARKELGI